MIDQPFPPSSKRVLLVEDEQDIRRVAETSLTRVGRWQVSAAASGEEALQRATTETFDAVLMDVRLAGMDGPTTLGKLRELPGGFDVPVIFLTANTQRQDLVRLEALGVAGVLAKPFDPMELPAQVAALLGWSA